MPAGTSCSKQIYLHKYILKDVSSIILWETKNEVWLNDTTIATHTTTSKSQASAEKGNKCDMKESNNQINNTQDIATTGY